MTDITATSTTTYVAQCNDRPDFHTWEDLDSCPSPEEAEKVIKANILDWQVAQHNGTLRDGRPGYYRIIRRTVTEKVLGTVEDDGRSLLEKLGES